MARYKLNPRLDLITRDLVEEATDALRSVFDSLTGTEPHYRRIKDDMLEVVARLSTRVFLGKELARSPAWLQIAKQYTVDIFAASILLHLLPATLQPFANWLLPISWRLRRHVQDARMIMHHEIEAAQARVLNNKNTTDGKTQSAGSLDWMMQITGNRAFDYAAGQLGLSVAAIHTTSEMATKAILQLCNHPEVIPHLREEACNTLTTHGWTKYALSQMELLDSFLKEVQRLNRGGIGESFLDPRPVTRAIFGLLSTLTAYMLQHQCTD